MLHTTKNGQRYTTQGPESECIAFALSLADRGEKVRLSASWGQSFHNPYFILTVTHGPAVREPMSSGEIHRFLQRCYLHLKEVFSLSRRYEEEK